MARALMTRPSPPTRQRLQLQIPDADLDELLHQVAVLQQRRERGQSKVPRQPTQTSLVRLGLIHLFKLPTEEIEALLEKTFPL
jgi:hypothetical protein